MHYYYVFVWAADSNQWTPIKRFASPVRRGIIFDNSERLTREQAQQRLNELQVQHPTNTFKIDTIEWQGK